MKNIVWGLGAALLTACASAPQKQADFDWAAHETPLTHQVLKPDTLLGSVASLVAVDTTLFVSCIDTDPICTKFVVRGDSLLMRESFLRKGRGPAEAMLYADLQYFPADSSLRVFCYMGGDNFRFSFPLRDEALLGQPARWERQPVSEQNTALFSQLLFVDSQNFVVQCFDPRDEMFRYGTPDTLCPLGVPYPDDGQNAGTIAKAAAYAGMLVKHPTEPKFVYASRGSGKYVFTFAVDTVARVVTERNVLLDEYPLYDVRPDGVNAVARPDSPRPVRCAANGEHIFVLYVGGTFEHPEPGGANSDRVRVYDWEGNPVGSLRLDVPVYMLHADPQGRYLYGQATDPSSGEPLLFRFTLPD